MEASTAEITLLAVNSLTGITTGKQKSGQKTTSVHSDNHILHFTNLPRYLLLDIVDLLKQSKIDDWNIYNKDKDIVLSFRPEIKSDTDAFFDNLKGCQIPFNRITL